MHKNFPLFIEADFRDKLDKTLNREIYETPVWSATYLIVMALGTWYSEPATRAKNWKESPGWCFWDSAKGLLDILFKETGIESMQGSILFVCIFSVQKVACSINHAFRLYIYKLFQKHR